MTQSRKKTQTIREINRPAAIRAHCERELAQLQQHPGDDLPDPEVLAGAIEAITWLHTNAIGVTHLQWKARARALLHAPLHAFFSGHVSDQVILRASEANLYACNLLFDAVKVTRSEPNMDADLPGEADLRLYSNPVVRSTLSVVRALTYLTIGIPVIRSPARDMRNPDPNHGESPRTRGNNDGSEFCRYCEQPSQLYLARHRAKYGLAAGCMLTAVSKFVWNSVNIKLNPTVCASHAQIKKRDKLYSGARKSELILHEVSDTEIKESAARVRTANNNIELKDSIFRNFEHIVRQSGQYYPYSIYIREKVSWILAQSKLRKDSRILAAVQSSIHLQTFAFVESLLHDFPFNHGCRSDYIRVDDSLAELTVGSDGFLIRVDNDGNEFCYDVASQGELANWRSWYQESFLKALSPFIDIRRLHRPYMQVTTADPRDRLLTANYAGATSKSAKSLLVADISIVRPSIDIDRGYFIVRRAGFVQRNWESEDLPMGWNTEDFPLNWDTSLDLPAGFFPLRDQRRSKHWKYISGPADTRKADRPGTFVTIAFLSPTWLRKVCDGFIAPQ